MHANDIALLVKARSFTELFRMLIMIYVKLKNTIKSAI